ncbi:MAG TPA: translation elongation factor Ts [Gemmataceae bacterium]|jgi:elongation factor Ts|nr:translation elongation factor Ts [Gemmataceae bacterium]
MSEISATAVKELRDKTNLPMMDCKKALVEAGGDMEKAIQILRERNKNVAVKRGERETAEGRIGTFIDPPAQVGAIVEVRCESPMVAKAEDFIQLAHDLAKEIALSNPKTTDELLARPFLGDTKRTVKDRIDEAIGLIRENMRVARFRQLTGLVGEYVHHDGALGVLLQVTGAKAEPVLLRDVCTHIAALNPQYLNPAAIPADVAEKEKQLAKQQAAEQAAGKPANVVEKIAEGRFRTWMEESVLSQQPIANQMKYGKKTVGDLLKAAGLELKQFIRYKVGEITTNEKAL